MRLTLTSVAFGFVVLGAAALAIVGHPTALAPPSPTTPGGARIAAAAPPAPAAVTVTAAPNSVSAAGYTLVSASIDLPSSDRGFPAGPGHDVAEQNCTACHSAGMVLNQPALPRATWDAEVHKMISVYKAPVATEDAAVIVDYLARIKSPG